MNSKYFITILFIILFSIDLFGQCKGTQNFTKEIIKEFETDFRKPVSNDMNPLFLPDRLISPNKSVGIFSLNEKIETHKDKVDKLKDPDLKQYLIITEEIFKSIKLDNSNKYTIYKDKISETYLFAIDNVIKLILCADNSFRTDPGDIRVGEVEDASGRLPKEFLEKKPKVTWNKDELYYFHNYFGIIFIISKNEQGKTISSIVIYQEK